MAARKNKLRLTGQDLLAIAGDLGVSARIFSDNEVRQLLRAAVERAGTQVAFAKRHGVDRAHLNQVLKGKSRVSRSLLKCLGLRKSYTIDQAAKPGRRTEAHPLLLPWSASRLDTRPLAHDPEKWIPVFRKAHAQTRS